MIIDENWKITYDRYSYTLYEYAPVHARDTGEYRRHDWKVRGHFANMGQALRKCAELKVGNQSSVKEWIHEYDRVTKEIMNED